MTSETTPIVQPETEINGDTTGALPLPEATVTKAPTSGSGIVAALNAQRLALGHIWKGNPVQAFRLATATKHFWLVTFGVYSVLVGLLMASLTARSVSAVDGFVGSITSSLTGYSTSGMIELSFGRWFSIFLTGLVIGFVAFTLRTLCVKWSFAVRGVSQTFGTAGNVVATAYLAQLAVLLVATVLFLVPSMIVTSIVMLVVALIGFPLFLVTEILIYIGINRTARFTKSVLIPHAIFTGLWVVMTVIAYFIMFSLFLESAS